MSDVVVIGGCNLDIKARIATRQSPGTSNPGHITFTSGGVARNISHNLSQLGVNVSLISVVGQDEAAATILRETSAADVDISHICRIPSATGIYVAILDAEGEMLTAVNDMAALAQLDISWLEARKSLLVAARFIVTDCNIELACLRWLVEHYGEKLIVEPVSIAKSEKLLKALEGRHIYLTTPNRSQLQAVTQIQDLAPAALKLYVLGCENSVTHLGEQGAYVMAGAEGTKLKAFASNEIRDVTGAGDAAVAGLVYGLCRGYDVLRSAQLGQAAASVVLSSMASAAETLKPGILEKMID